MQSPLPISGPLSLGELLDRSFRLYRSQFGLLLLTCAIFLIPFGIVSGLVTGRSMTGYLEFVQEMAVNPGESPEQLMTEFFTGFGTFFGVMLILFILTIVINGIVTLALTNQSIAILHDSPLSLTESIRRGLGRFWAYIGMNLVMIGAMGLAMLVIAGILMCVIFALTFTVAGIGAGASGGGNPFEDPTAFIGIIVLVICLYAIMILLFIAPLIYLSARWIVAVPGLVEQKLGPIEALRRSWTLTQGRIWRSIGYSVLLYLLSFVVYILPATVIQQVLTIFTPPEMLSVVIGVSSVLGTLFSVLWQPFYIAALLLFYYDLRVRTEGYDLSLRIEQLESNIQPPTV